MSYLMHKPTPPVGYTMLRDGIDQTTAYDFIWVVELKDSRVVQRWAHAIKQTDRGLALASDTGQLYKEPKTLEDYCFFRCRKMGVQR